MKIVTITINPAYDIHYNLNDFKIGIEQYCEDIKKDAGGKGVNVSKALSNNGISSDAYIILGKNNSQLYKYKPLLSIFQAA